MTSGHVAQVEPEMIKKRAMASSVVAAILAVFAVAAVDVQPAAAANLCNFISDPIQSISVSGVTMFQSDGCWNRHNPSLGAHELRGYRAIQTAKEGMRSLGMRLA
jgi:hypothetical protein